jgi:DNA-binding GntR family transcriptional regulator
VTRAAPDVALASLASVQVTRTSTAARVADALRQEVVEGRLRPGSAVPEVSLATALHVSRNTVREALTQLVAERVLVREPNKGVSVAVPGADDVRDVYRARRLIEPAAMRDGESAGDRNAVARVRAAVDEGRDAAERDDEQGVASANQHFHRAVVALAGSPRLDQQMDLLLAEMRLVFHRMSEHPAFHEPYLDLNDEIVGLLEAGDREAAATRLVDYLDDAEARILAVYATL